MGLRPDRLCLVMLLVALAGGLLGGPADAVARKVAPPGNSGVSQYLESIPTAGGDQASNTIHPGGPVHGASLSGGGGGGATAADGSGAALSSSTVRALEGHGHVGAEAAALAAATSPGPSGSGGHGHPAGTAADASGSRATASLTAVARVLTGTTNPDTSVDLFLPVILLAALVGMIALRVMR